MNLALLDPFRRQVPDRIDSTLTLPRNFHPPRSQAGGAYSSPSKKKNAPTLSTSKKRKSRTLSEQEAANAALQEMNEWHSCFAVKFNRRGNYIAAGHGSGAVPFHDFASRTLSGIYTPSHSILRGRVPKKNESKTEDNAETESDDGDDNDNDSGIHHGSKGDSATNLSINVESNFADNLYDNQSQERNRSETSSIKTDTEAEKLFRNGITSISWSRRSRRLLIASFNDRHICLLDNSHPFCAQDAFKGLKYNPKGSSKSSSESSNIHSGRSESPVTPSMVEDKGDDDTGSQGDDTHSPAKLRRMSNHNSPQSKGKHAAYRGARYVNKMTLYSSSNAPSPQMEQESDEVESDEEEAHLIQTVYHQSLVMPLPEPLGVCSQIHPSGNGGLACLKDGSLVIFRAPNAFERCTYSDPELTRAKSIVEGHYIYLSQPKDEQMDANSFPARRDSDHVKQYHVTHATFDSRGHCIYASTKCGKLLFFRFNAQFESHMFRSPSSINKPLEDPISKFVYMDLKCNGIALQIVLSRNDQKLLLNCKDSLKLYDISEFVEGKCSDDGEVAIKARLTFQDVVSKSKWYACDFSGDGEYVVGGCNNEESGDKYELYFWNTTTGKFEFLTFSMILQSN